MISIFRWPSASMVFHLLSVESIFSYVIYDGKNNGKKWQRKKNTDLQAKNITMKIKKRDVSFAKAGKKSATGWKIWYDGYKKGRNVNITGRRVPGICIIYNLH